MKDCPMDYQFLTLLILFILTIALVTLIVYVVLLIKTVRTIAEKVNMVMDNVKGVADFFSSPLSSLTGIISGIVSVLKEIRKDQK